MQAAFGSMSYLCRENLPDDPEEYEYDKECENTYTESYDKFHNSYNKLFRQFFPPKK